MRLKTGLFLLPLFVFFLAGGALHHHPDGQTHEDCLRCVLGIQGSFYLAPSFEFPRPLSMLIPSKAPGGPHPTSLTERYPSVIRAPPHPLLSVSP
jgi:hypothetical protein